MFCLYLDFLLINIITAKYSPIRGLACIAVAAYGAFPLHFSRERIWRTDFRVLQPIRAADQGNGKSEFNI